MRLLENDGSSLPFLVQAVSNKSWGILEWGLVSLAETTWHSPSPALQKRSSFRSSMSGWGTPMIHSLDGSPKAPPLGTSRNSNQLRLEEAE